MKSSLFRLGRQAMSAPRALRPSDGAACAALHRASFAHPWAASEFEALLTDSACFGEAIEAKSRLAGFVLSRRALDEAEILTIVVDTRLRQRGCGQRLLAAHLSQLSALGVIKLFLEVDETNEAALALYRRLGFTQLGMRKGYYVKKDGLRANALILGRAQT
ncbi:ribosomal protein S18-alanine N-acetyltransferase [uncultured Rhodoblastus sp.]|uniref:ribosomal protein S18-alanine N-acetyltransferase n=1 Tax=uncultured Rhodoblastus sp. TaxID=543037 RepID=UPI0025ED4E34|nr:ribosomal protein S18-alanine N-acetyltransferase [uncultured Rhodoblastus sp.]